MTDSPWGIPRLKLRRGEIPIPAARHRQDHERHGTVGGVGYKVGRYPGNSAPEHDEFDGEGRLPRGVSAAKRKALAEWEAEWEVEAKAKAEAPDPSLPPLAEFNALLGLPQRTGLKLCEALNGAAKDALLHTVEAVLCRAPEAGLDPIGEAATQKARDDLLRMTELPPSVAGLVIETLRLHPSAMIAALNADLPSPAAWETVVTHDGAFTPLKLIYDCVTKSFLRKRVVDNDNKNTMGTTIDLNAVADKAGVARETAVRLIEQQAAEAAREATARAGASRLKWGHDNKPDENPAEFAWRAYQAEAKAGTLHLGIIRQDDKRNGTDLAGKLVSWLRSPANRKLVPEGFDIPTKPEWNERQLEKRSELRASIRTIPEVRELRRLDAVASRLAPSAG